ncbi:MarR family transcriptional regulator [Microbispora sp. NEAU-D428]|uniref:MarR family winged helix-turn-helix transcriptional regulator n=1 Tax=Microbispora sitophila TaxID=2771537 RepID=UPI001868509E|nr:MarR family transcriptional regulator [Microbispora sitophila]MBE3008138.1 MarR family transcriptional regulator [Microbispora sitophila]
MLVGQTHTGRAGSPQDIAESVHWLASPGGGHVTAQIIQVNGGAERGRLLATLGVDVATLDLLSTLRRSGPPYRMSPGEPAEACMVTRGAITQRVERAARAGLVERTTAGSGYHARAVALTDAGNALLDHVVADLLVAEDRLVGHLSPERREQLAGLLRGLLAGLGGPSLTGQVGD